MRTLRRCESALQLEVRAHETNRAPLAAQVALDRGGQEVGPWQEQRLERGRKCRAREAYLSEQKAKSSTTSLKWGTRRMSVNSSDGSTWPTFP